MLNFKTANLIKKYAEAALNPLPPAQNTSVTPQEGSRITIQRSVTQQQPDSGNILEPVKTIVTTAIHNTPVPTFTPKDAPDIRHLDLQKGLQAIIEHPIDSAEKVIYNNSEYETSRRAAGRIASYNQIMAAARKAKTGR